MSPRRDSRFAGAFVADAAPTEADPRVALPADFDDALPAALPDGAPTDFPFATVDLPAALPVDFDAPFAWLAPAVLRPVIDFGALVPADFTGVLPVVALRAAGLPAAGRDFADFAAVDVLPADFAGVFAVAVRARPVAALEVARPDGDLDAVPAEAGLAADLPAADPAVVLPTADFVAPARPAVLLAEPVFAAGLLPLPPPLLLTAAVLAVAAFLAAGLLAPVFLLADLRGLVVAMRVSRIVRAVVGGSSSIAPAACTPGDRGANDHPPNDGCISPCRNAGPTRGSSSSVNSTPYPAPHRCALWLTLSRPCRSIQIE